jgi:hypothetical protein
MGHFDQLLAGKVTRVTGQKNKPLPKSPNDTNEVTGVTGVTGKIEQLGSSEGGGASLPSLTNGNRSRVPYYFPVTSVTSVTSLKTKGNSGNKGFEDLVTSVTGFQTPDIKEIKRVMHSADPSEIEGFVAKHPDIGERAANMEYCGHLDRAAANFAALYEYLTEVENAE